MFQLHQDAEYLIVIINWEYFRNYWLLAFHFKSIRHPVLPKNPDNPSKTLDTKVLQIIELSLHHVIQTSSDSKCSQKCHDLNTHQEKKKV